MFRFGVHIFVNQYSDQHFQPVCIGLQSQTYGAWVKNLADAIQAGLWTQPRRIAASVYYDRRLAHLTCLALNLSLAYTTACSSFSILIAEDLPIQLFSTCPPALCQKKRYGLNPPCVLILREKTLKG